MLVLFFDINIKKINIYINFGKINKLKRVKGKKN